MNWNQTIWILKPLRRKPRLGLLMDPSFAHLGSFAKSFVRGARRFHRRLKWSPLGPKASRHDTWDCHTCRSGQGWFQGSMGQQSMPVPCSLGVSGLWRLWSQFEATVFGGQAISGSLVLQQLPGQPHGRSPTACQPLEISAPACNMAIFQAPKLPCRSSASHGHGRSPFQEPNVHPRCLTRAPRKRCSAWGGHPTPGLARVD